MLASMVIPAYKPYTLLDTCLTSIMQNTDEHLVEIIVVCNGSDRESANLILNKFPNVKLVWYAEALGFTRAANIGFSLASTPVTVICNTDVVLLDFAGKNSWLYQLTQPFEDPTVGITGMCSASYKALKFFPFFFTAIRTELFKKIGYLDLAFSPGYGEDADFCMRATLANYKLVNVVEKENINDSTNTRITGPFPLYHTGEGSFRDPDQRRDLIKNAYKVLDTKYNLDYIP